MPTTDKKKKCKKNWWTRILVENCVGCVRFLKVFTGILRVFYTDLWQPTDDGETTTEDNRTSVRQPDLSAI